MIASFLINFNKIIALFLILFPFTVHILQLFIIFCVPFTAWDYAYSFWPFGSTWCKVVQYLIVVCAYASIYTVSTISDDGGE